MHMEWVLRSQHDRRCSSVREKLLREAASRPYLQRKHMKLASTGFVMHNDTDAEEPSRALRPPATVCAKIEECRKCREWCCRPPRTLHWPFG